VINIAGRYQLNESAKDFYEKASMIVKDAGFDLRFTLAALVEAA
jgi:hypothetical protein